MRTICWVGALALASVLCVAHVASAAEKSKQAAARPDTVIAPAPRVDSTARKGAAMGRRRDPRRGRGRLVGPATPSKRDSGVTTIAPYPVPHDTSRDAAARGRVLNLPRPGTTTVAPLPSPAPGIPIGEIMSSKADRNARPKWGDYVYVTELPEAIARVSPTYPDSARERGIQGTVQVAALVLPDGSVGEARAVQPLRWLDEAAVACVRQWRFKPALNDTTPVAVWVNVPVKFTLH